MHITPLFSQFQAGKLTKERFAEKLGISPHQLSIRLGKHGDQITPRLRILDKIADNLITRDQAAIEWGGVNVRTINAAMAAWGVERQATEDAVGRVAAKVKWEVIKKYTLDFIEGTLDLAKTASAAHLSERQLRRWVSALLKKHYDMPFKDLKEVSQLRRAALANDIRVAEDLESDKLRQIRPVLTGELSRYQVAEMRIATKRAAKAKLRAEKMGSSALAKERNERRLISDLVKTQGLTYTQFKSLPKGQRDALLKGAGEKETRLPAPH